jgi:hypothetical protein
VVFTKATIRTVKHFSMWQKKQQYVLDLIQKEQEQTYKTVGIF